MITRKSLNVMILSVVVLSLAGSLFAADAGAGSSSNVPAININTASASQLALLPRVGEKVAGRIVAYREKNGPFRRATDLMQVKGIGDKSFELLRPYLTVEGETTLKVKQHAPRKPKAASTESPTSQAQ